MGAAGAVLRRAVEKLGEVRSRQLCDYVPFERVVVRDRGLSVRRPEKDREGKLCRSGAAVSPTEAVRRVPSQGE